MRKVVRAARTDQKTDEVSEGDTGEGERGEWNKPEEEQKKRKQMREKQVKFFFLHVYGCFQKSKIAEMRGERSNFSNQLLNSNAFRKKATAGLKCINSVQKCPRVKWKVSSG